MNKGELVDAIAEKVSVSKKNIEVIVTAALESIVEAVADGDRVTLVGFGSFEPRDAGLSDPTSPGITGNSSPGCYSDFPASGALIPSMLPMWKAGHSMPRAWARSSACSPIPTSGMGACQTSSCAQCDWW